MFEESLKFYKDFPTPGIKFVDIMPLFQDKEKFINLIKETGSFITAPSVAVPEARAFLFASPLLCVTENVSNMIPFRKKGKLPSNEGDMLEVEIMKEYGSDKLFYRKSDIAAGKIEDGVFKIAILDDILATGGTAEGMARSLESIRIEVDGKEYGIKVTEFVFIVEIDGLEGRKRLESIAPAHSVAHI